MSYIEFQVSATTFLRAQRSALQSGKQFLCPPPPVPVGPSTVVFDRIEFGNNAIRHDVETNFAVFYTDHGETLPTPNTVTGFQTQIAQDVTVFLTELSDVVSRPNQPPSFVVPISGTIVFDVDFYALDDDCYTRVVFKRFEPGPLPSLGPLPIPVGQLVQIVNNRLATTIPSPALPAGLGKLSPGGDYLNAGVSVDPQLGRIAFRAQIGGSYSGLDVPWTNFFHGHFEDRLLGKDWSFSVDSGLITETLKTRVNQALAGEHLPPDLAVYPGAYYSHSGGNAVFTLDVLAIYNFINDVLDVQEDFKVPISMSVTAPNALTLDIDLSQILNFRDAYLKAILLIATALGIPVESLVLGMIGSAAIGALADEGLDCQQLSPTHIRCTRSVRLPAAPGVARATLTDLFAFTNAVALAGTMVVPELTASSLELSLNEFEKKIPTIDCATATMALIAAFHDDPSGFKVLHAKGFIGNHGSAPLYLCGAPTVLNDSLGVFSPANISTDSDEAPITISLDVPIPRAQYFTNPYPCDLLLQTTGGTRLMRFAAPADVAAADLTALEAELLVKVGNCHVLTDPGTLHTGVDVHWIPDPPDLLIPAHILAIAVAGVVAGDTLAVVDSAGTELMRATSRSTTPLRLSVLVPPGGDKDLRVFVNGEAAPATLEAANVAYSAPDSRESGPRVGLRQTVLANLGSVPLSGECLRLLPSHLEGGRGLMAVMTDGIAAYDFGTTARPVSVRTWQIENVRGALDWHGTLVYFGDDGFGTIDREGRAQAVLVDCEVVSILDAAADSDGLYALTAEGLDVYSKRFYKHSTTAVVGGRGVVRVGRRVAVGGRDGFVLIDTADVRRPQREKLFDGVQGTVVLQPLPTAPRSFLAVMENGTAKSFQWSQDTPEETASYSHTPWFADSVRLGSLLVSIGRNRRHLQLYRFGPTHVT